MWTVTFRYDDGESDGMDFTNEEHMWNYCRALFASKIKKVIVHKVKWSIFNIFKKPPPGGHFIKIGEYTSAKELPICTP